jgi:hypothetical protein
MINVGNTIHKALADKKLCLRRLSQFNKDAGRNEKEEEEDSRSQIAKRAREE